MLLILPLLHTSADNADCLDLQHKYILAQAATQVRQASDGRTYHHNRPPAAAPVQNHFSHARISMERCKQAVSKQAEAIRRSNVELGRQAERRSFCTAQENILRAGTNFNGEDI